MNDFLPIGSVVQLKKSTKRVMIIGSLHKNTETGEIYDYAGCTYPEGLLSATISILFNREDIGAVFALGYMDKESLEFREKVIEKAEEVKPSKPKKTTKK